MPLTCTNCGFIRLQSARVLDDPRSEHSAALRTPATSATARRLAVGRAHSHRSPITRIPSRLDGLILGGATPVLGRWCLRQLHDGRKPRPCEGNLRGQLRPAHPGESNIRPRQRLPRQPEHPTSRLTLKPPCAASSARRGTDSETRGSRSSTSCMGRRCRPERDRAAPDPRLPLPGMSEKEELQARVAGAGGLATVWWVAFLGRWARPMKPMPLMRAVVAQPVVAAEE